LEKYVNIYILNKLYAYTHTHTHTHTHTRARARARARAQVRAHTFTSCMNNYIFKNTLFVIFFIVIIVYCYIKI